jgi:phosphate transport system permease protein
MISAIDFGAVIKRALRDAFPDVSSRKDKKLLYQLVSSGAEFPLSDMLQANPDLIGQKSQSVWLKADDDVDTYYKLGTHTSRVADRQVEMIEQLRQDDHIRVAFNTTFFTASDSREPEQAGIRGAIAGSFWTLLVTLLVSLPVGVAAAIYLEEFAPQNRFTDFIEININNLAAVPSIVFGMLGLAVFINFFGMPRSAPMVGGLVLSLMTLPTIIISSRAALKSVPPSIKEAALGIGASKMQVVFHHTLPLAMPGILTGSIIGMAQALGESAPLLMIGMVAFIVDVPGGIFDSATVLPVQIYLWSDSPERAFTALTAATILVLLGFLIAMNAIAIYLRKRFERRW